MRQIISTDEATEIILQRDGKPTTVVLSFDRYQALQRELEALRQGARPYSDHTPTSSRVVKHWEELLGPEPPVGEESVDEFLADLQRQREEARRNDW